MKTKTLLALIVLVHALGHPLVHALPGLAAGAEQAQGPSSPSPPAKQINGSVPCAACVAHRLLPAVTLLATALDPDWEPLAPAPRLQVSSFFLLVRSARAPPRA